MDMTSKDVLEVGDFVTVPAWKTFGQVIATRPSDARF